MSKYSIDDQLPSFTKTSAFDIASFTDGEALPPIPDMDELLDDPELNPGFGLDQNIPVPVAHGTTEENSLSSENDMEIDNDLSSSVGSQDEPPAFSIAQIMEQQIRFASFESWKEALQKEWKEITPKSLELWKGRKALRLEQQKTLAAKLGVYVHHEELKEPATNLRLHLVNEGYTQRVEYAENYLDEQFIALAKDKNDPEMQSFAGRFAYEKAKLKEERQALTKRNETIPTRTDLINQREYTLRFIEYLEAQNYAEADDMLRSNLRCYLHDDVYAHHNTLIPRERSISPAPGQKPYTEEAREPKIKWEEKVVKETRFYERGTKKTNQFYADEALTTALRPSPQINSGCTKRGLRQSRDSKRQKIIHQEEGASLKSILNKDYKYHTPPSSQEL